MLITFDYLEGPWINHQFQPQNMVDVFQPLKKTQLSLASPRTEKLFALCTARFLRQAPVVLDPDTNLSTLLFASLVKNKLLQTTLDACF